MKFSLHIVGMLLCFACQGQRAVKEDISQLPVFKAVSHPFMPIITAEYFYFSADGLMWFSTARGLCSFDGSEVVQYSTQEQAYAFGLNAISTIAEDSYNNLYIGGEGKLSYFNRQNKTFTNLSMPTTDSIAPFVINACRIYIDRAGMVYIGTIAKGLLIYDAIHKQFRHCDLDLQTNRCWDHENLNTVSSFATHLSDTTKLWVGSFNGIYLFDKITRKFTRNFLVINPSINKFTSCPALYDIRKMDVTDDSTIWFNTASNGFGKYNTVTGKTKLFMHGGRIHTKDMWKGYNIHEFAKWTSGKYILGITDPEPGIFDVKEEKLRLFEMYHKARVYDNIQYVTNDRNGNVWILSKGLLYVSMPDYYRLRTVNIKNQPTRDYLSNRLGDIYYDKPSCQYYAAVPFSSGVYVLDSNLAIKKVIPAPLYTNKWTYKETCTEWITKDGSGRFWASGMETYLLRPGKDRFEHAGKIYPAIRWIASKGESWDITATNTGDVLIRFDSAVYRIDHQKLTTDSVILGGYQWHSQNVIGTTEIVYDSTRNKLYYNNQKYIIQYDYNTKRCITLSYDLLFGAAGRNEPAPDYALDVQGRLFNSKNRVQVIEYALDNRGRIWIWIPSFGVRIIDPDKLVCTDSIQNGTRGLINGSFTFMRYGGNDCMCFVGLGGIVVYNFVKQQSLLFDANNGWSGEFNYYKGCCNNHLFIGGRNQIEYFNLADFSKFELRLQPLLNTISAVGSGTVFTRSAADENIQITLPYDQNSLTFSFSAPEFFFPERIEYAYQLSNADKGWQYSNSFNRKITYTQLPPGRYTFKLKAQIQGGNWNANSKEYVIIIRPAYWQTWWFRLLVIMALLFAVVAFYRKRISNIHAKAVQKSKHEKELLQLEAKALRSQMNPHFIFNCMNSIKSLIQQDNKDKATNYLTTFSKLIRTIFQNSDSREITLFDEIETCRLYTQLEAMRFDNKFTCRFEIDEALDLKSVMVPSLILQPFIENAIWHGIMPKPEGGTVIISVQRVQQAICCSIADDGIGRDMSLQNKFISDFPKHQSRGVHLTHKRIDLDNLLNERKATLEIVDQRDTAGTATGTIVSITFNEY